jgi:D-beta-D-heptose 7-phosphate kinase/D-beta-D-heptose 1-phosphate adenosyltransferase
MGQLLGSKELAAAVRKAQARGLKVVFTNGCFDILHLGHVHYLSEARRLGDLLVVGLNSDASVRRLKGEGRPIVPQEDRAGLLCALSSVDYVCVFDEDTPGELIRLVSPDVLVKGGDYRPEDIVGADFVTQRGGAVRVIPTLPGRSTKLLIDTIVRRFSSG